MSFKGVSGFEWRKSSVQRNVDCNEFEFWGISYQVATDIQTTLKCFSQTYKKCEWSVMLLKFVKGEWSDERVAGGKCLCPIRILASYFVYIYNETNLSTWLVNHLLLYSTASHTDHSFDIKFDCSFNILINKVLILIAVFKFQFSNSSLILDIFHNTLTWN